MRWGGGDNHLPTPFAADHCTGGTRRPDPASSHDHDGPVMIVSFAVVSWLIVLCVHDLRARVLPNRFTMPAGVAAVAMGLADPHIGLSIVLLAGPYLVASALGACGGGDLKLAIGLGGVVADPALALLVVGTAAVATLVIAAMRDPAARRTGVAHGPALAGAAVVVGGVWV